MPSINSARELRQVVDSLAELNSMRVTMSESLKGGALVGGTTLIGGLLMGSKGLAVGGILGGLAAAYYGQGKFKSVISVIKDDLTPTQQADLGQRISYIASTFNITDITPLLALMASNENARMAIIKEIVNYIKNEMSVDVV